MRTSPRRASGREASDAIWPWHLLGRSHRHFQRSDQPQQAPKLHSAPLDTRQRADQSANNPLADSHRIDDGTWVVPQQSPSSLEHRLTHRATATVQISNVTARCASFPKANNTLRGGRLTWRGRQARLVELSSEQRTRRLISAPRLCSPPFARHRLDTQPSMPSTELGINSRTVTDPSVGICIAYCDSTHELAEGRE